MVGSMERIETESNGKQYGESARERDKDRGRKSNGQDTKSAQRSEERGRLPSKSHERDHHRERDTNPERNSKTDRDKDRERKLDDQAEERGREKESRRSNGRRHSERDRSRDRDMNRDRDRDRHHRDRHSNRHGDSDEGSPPRRHMDRRRGNRHEGSDDGSPPIRREKDRDGDRHSRENKVGREARDGEEDHDTKRQLEASKPPSQLPPPPPDTGNTGRSGGVYIPPFKMAQMMKEIQDKSGEAYQRLSWDALRKSINGLVNKVNATNIKNIIPELLSENLIRGRGLFCRSCMKSQMASPGFTDVFAALVAVVNTKFPEVGKLLLRRIVLQLKRAYKRNDKPQLLAATKFIAHLVNQQVAHEIIALELLTVLLENPTDDSVEVAVGFVKECGMLLQDLSPRGLHAYYLNPRYHFMQQLGSRPELIRALEKVVSNLERDPRTQSECMRQVKWYRDQLGSFGRPSAIAALENTAPGIFERFRGILHEGEIDKRVQFLIEGLFATRKAKFQGHPAVRAELDLVDLEDQFTHEASLEDEIDPETSLDVFRPNPQFLEDEKAYEDLKKSILGGDSAEDEEEGSDAPTDDEEDDDSEEEDAENMQIKDETETNLVNLRRTIYLTIMSSVDFEEAGHKLLKIKLEPGQEMELCIMLLECCSQERTYLRYYGLLGQRFCMINKVHQENFEKCFVQQYSMIHRLETNKLRNVAKFFAHLLGTDALPWDVLAYIRLTEEDTTSSSRIFIKILFQELSEHLGIRLLNERLTDPTMQDSFESIFPRDNPKNTRFSINFFTSIGLGGITENLREYLKNMPRLIMQQQKPVSESDDESGSSSASSSSGSSSGSESESSDSQSTSESDRRHKRRKRN